MLYAVGTYTTLGGPGIALIRAGKESLALLCQSAAMANPTWVMASPGGRVLYAACADGEAKKGMVASFSWNEKELTLLSSQPTGGAACCHLALDEDESHLYATNYLDGSVSVFPLEKGRILPCCQFIQHTGKGPHPTRQEGPHAHQITFRPGTQEAFVCDLGADKIIVYQRLADGTLAASGEIPGEPGTGPRHLLFDGPNRFYLVGELTGWISVYAWDGHAWRCEQTLSTLPAGFSGVNTAAALRMDGNRLYVSNRGHDSIAVFEIQKDSSLRAAGFLPVPGCFPRDFRIVDGGFLVAQQKVGGVALMDAHGKPGAHLEIPGAVCLCPLG